MSIYGRDVDTTLKNFGVGLKQMHSQRMAALLIDIDAAMKEDDGPSVHFPTGGGVEDENMDGADGHDDEGTANHADEEIPAADSEETDNDNFVVEARAADMDPRTLVVDMPQSTVLLDSSTGGDVAGEQVAVDSLVTSPMNSPFARIPEGISVEAWNRAPDPPSIDLFSQDPDEVVVPEQQITIPAEEITLPADVASVVKLDDTSSEQPKAMEATTPPIPSRDAEDHLGENVSPQHPTNTGENVTVIKRARLVAADDKLSLIAGIPLHVGSTVIVAERSPSPSDVVTKDASTGAKTVEKKTRYKRAAKGELSPPKLKKIKVSQDVVRKYGKYVSHGHKFKRKKKNEVSKEFLKIGRFFCSYKSFIGALRPRQYLSNVVMAVWTEKFNHAAKASAEKNPRNHKRYAFSPYFAVSNLLHFSLPSLSHVITCFIIFYCFQTYMKSLL
ncbi:uncharacterized protein [Lolium perenne]|uniref:uncharacterized protein isoform X1 n=1 Tax=Lolium perenne TaxID=4522 RepID=UPI0021F66668|nr:uncharacterized protein LOC127319541 isoform X1 [Lolium perenne]